MKKLHLNKKGNSTLAESVLDHSRQVFYLFFFSSLPDFARQKFVQSRSQVFWMFLNTYDSSKTQTAKKIPQTVFR